MKLTINDIKNLFELGIDIELEQKELKLLFDRDVLAKAIIAPDPEAIGDFNVVVIQKDKKFVSLITANERARRRFKTIQVAINTLEKIGFKTIEVLLK